MCGMGACELVQMYESHAPYQLTWQISENKATFKTVISDFAFCNRLFKLWLVLAWHLLH